MRKYLNFIQNKGLVLALSLLLIAASCVPSEQAIQTAIAQTNTHEAFLHPSSTPTVKSPTPTITNTLTRTATKTRTPTHTPIPPETITALAIEAYQISTAQAISAMQTATVAMRITRQTATAVQATKMAEYLDIYFQELVSYAEKHKGEKVKIHIRIFNIVGDRELQGYFGGTYDAVYVQMKTSFSSIYENDSITVYGVVGGDYCFQNAYDATICQPIIEQAFYTKP